MVVTIRFYQGPTLGEGLRNPVLGHVNTNINIARWACWAPGCEDAKTWQSWVQGGSGPGGKGSPDLPQVKPLQRRRLTPLARAAFFCADRCLEGIDHPVCVFSSTYGQPAQTLKLLQSLAQDRPLSPGLFSLSVHNAVGGLFSIIHHLTGTNLTIAAGADGIGAAFLEAAGLLAQGQAEHVLVVCFEGILPEEQKPFVANPPAIMAACFLVTRAPEGALTLGMERLCERHTPTPFWQQTRDLIGFLESDSHSMRSACPGCTWHWSRIENTSEELPANAGKND